MTSIPTGTSRNDTIDLGNVDKITIDGGAGNDTLTLGDGNKNTVDGGAGNDTIVLGTGAHNTVDGGSGNDDITVEDGTHDTIDGGAGNDSISVTGTDNTIDGGAGNDSITVDGTGNEVDGGAGNDDVTVTGDGNTIDAGSGNDSVTVEGAGNEINAGAGGDDITVTGNGNAIDAGSGNDNITITGDDNTVDAGSGDDNISVDGNNDTVYGGTGADTVSLSGNRDDYTIVFNSSTENFTVTDKVTGNTVVVHDDVEALQFKDTTVTICFMAGTLVRTPDGEVPVETLARGDMVVTSNGSVMPVCWLGRQTVSTRFGDPLRVLPIRIKAGALGENVPCRDLLLSPDHAILVDGALIQAGALVNGTSIVRERDVPEIFTYYHVELDDHSLIVAENVPAETFVDNVDRLNFDNWAEHQALYPNGKPINELPYPRAKAHRQVPVSIRVMLADQAERIGATGSKSESAVA